MNTPNSVNELETMQADLLKEFEITKLNVLEAKKILIEKKTALIKFNEKYGRVIQLMKED